MTKDVRAEGIVPVIGFKAKVLIRFHCIVTGILKLISKELIHESDSAAFLELINQNSDSPLPDLFKRKMELIPAIASTGGENVAGQALGVNAEQDGVLAGDIAHHQGDDIFGFVFFGFAGFETKEPERSKWRWK